MSAGGWATLDPATGRRVKLLQLSFGPDEAKRDVGGVTYTLGEGEWRDP